jgi:hypothetical protein
MRGWGASSGAMTATPDHLIRPLLTPVALFQASRNPAVALAPLASCRMPLQAARGMPHITARGAVHGIEDAPRDRRWGLFKAGRSLLPRSVAAPHGASRTAGNRPHGDEEPLTVPCGYWVGRASSGAIAQTGGACCRPPSSITAQVTAPPPGARACLQSRQATWTGTKGWRSSLVRTGMLGPLRVASQGLADTA